MRKPYLNTQVHLSTLTHWAMYTLLLASLLACGVDKPEAVTLAAENLPETVDFNLHVKPILSDKCYFCHGPDKAGIKGGVQLHSFEAATKEIASKPGVFPIVPGNLAKSAFFHRIVTEDKEMLMPPVESNLSLTAEEKAILIKWIEDGAEYKPHWSLVKPEKRPLPTVENKEWVKNEIDPWVLAKLEKEGLTPQQEAEKERLLRRASFDLTGLPPTPQEIDSFLADNSPDAFEKAVDKMIASPHYGEKMATYWMDLSRYADTHGYSVDRYRPTWRWRDWVIQSFNENMPFDQFLTWQMAGDLLPNPTREQLIATGFNRNHPQNMEGGIVNEEFRVEYVTDRTNTLGKGLLGLTLECSKCHDHKYDPISQKDYFSLFSFFNQTDEAGQIAWDNTLPTPTLLLKDAEQDSILSFLDQEIAKQQATVAKAKAEAQESKDFVNLKQMTKKGLISYYDFETLKDNAFTDRVNQSRKATVKEPEMWKKKALPPTVATGKSGKGVLLNGDEPLGFADVGAFDRHDPFSVSLWAKFPKALKKGVIFHTANGEMLYNYKGYHLYLEDHKLKAILSHNWPYNTIIVKTKEEVPAESWEHLTFTYDGSSKAAGIGIFLNGKPLTIEVERDNLYKSMLFKSDKHPQPAIRFGANYRGLGTKNAVIDEVKIYDRVLAKAEVQYLTDGTQNLKEEDKKELLAIHQKAYQTSTKALQALRAQRNNLEDELEEVMIMKDLQKNFRKTYVLERGAYDSHGEAVSPNTPNAVLPFDESYPKNRLGLAKWLVDENNPLVSRVIVNHFWQNFFGTGLVKTADDFGNQGEAPSHPELLDWLAVEFRTSGWDIKAIQKKIVLSATYRQSSMVSDEVRKNDPDNRLLARGPSNRMSAEMLRDNALAASQLLVKKIGGESVKPYHPKGLYLFTGGPEYVEDTGDKVYRRTMYTMWKRTVPPPSANTFDAPSRSYCVVKRQKTNTPLQSLVLLNDPQFLEASRALADKALKEKDSSAEQINFMYRSLTSLQPQKEEQALLELLYKEQYKTFTENPGKAKGWKIAGNYEHISQKDPNQIAALAVVANTIMNSDAAITIR